MEKMPHEKEEEWVGWYLRSVLFGCGVSTLGDLCVLIHDTSTPQYPNEEKDYSKKGKKDRKKERKKEIKERELHLCCTCIPSHPIVVRVCLFTMSTSIPR